MRRVYSFVAALVVAVVLASCASENDKNAEALVNAINANDNAKVSELVEVVKSAENVTADQAAVVLTAYMWQAGSQEGAAQVEAIENLLSYYETAQSIEGINDTFEALKAQGKDLVASIEAMKVAVEQAKAAQEEAAQATAEAAEAAENAENAEAAENAEEAAVEAE